MTHRNSEPLPELHPQRLARLAAKGPDANIVLIGFMGAGKSVVGRCLARMLNRFFVDADQVVEARARCSVAELFRREGEAEFRRQESEVVRQLGKLRRSVIATGGGAVMREENWAALSENGILVWLKAPLDVMMARAAGADRPLMAQGREALATLYAQREPLYARAHLSVDTQDATPPQVAQRIVEALEAAGWAGSPSQASQTGGEAQTASSEESLRLQIDLGRRSYPIWIGDNLLVRLGEMVREATAASRCLVVTHPRLSQLYGDLVGASLEAAGLRYRLCTIPDGEEHKNLSTVEGLYHEALEAGLDRRSVMIALGGGVVGDVTGFAAATFLRGIDFVQVPTTLLAQVDASVGGKVGVNLKEGKNLVGAFHQPKAVVADINTLLTLPQRELLAGLAEVIKHGLIADPSLIQRLEERREAVLAREREEMAYCVRRSCEIKGAVVAQDEREAGVRAWLNFGHTFAHGLEAASDYSGLIHGEAVSIGMVAALRLSARLGWIEAADVERIEKLLENFGLPRRATGVDPQRAWKAMEKDKKNRDGRIRLVLLKGLGSPVVTADVDPSVIFQVLESVCG